MAAEAAAQPFVIAQNLIRAAAAVERERASGVAPSLCLLDVVVTRVTIGRLRFKLRCT
jgi:hypothetical protein